MIFLKSRSLRITLPLAVLALPCYLADAGLSQGLPAPVQTQSAAPAAFPDPRTPELQPRLDVDRDPIASPDIEIPATNETSPTSGRTGELQKGKDGAYRLHADVDEVLLNCTVIDEKGQTVTDLRQENFRVWEDNVPQTTNSFVHQDQAVAMGILVDNSGSMRDKRAAVNSAALELLKESNRQDAAFVVNFSDRAYLDQGFTTDLVALDHGLSRFDSRGTTALYDAVTASADEISKHASQRKQVLLIITDGADNASRLSLEQTIRRVQDLGGPVVYSIGLLYDDDKQEATRARQDLEMLSEETGGVAYFPRSLQDVNSIASEVARDIRNQYTLAYSSTNPASKGGYRVVRVEAIAPGHGKLSVRARHGYYANTNPQKQQQSLDRQNSAKDTQTAQENR